MSDQEPMASERRLLLATEVIVDAVGQLVAGKDDDELVFVDGFFRSLAAQVGVAADCRRLPRDRARGCWCPSRALACCEAGVGRRGTDLMSLVSRDEAQRMLDESTPGPWSVQLPGEGLYDSPSVHAGGLFIAECANHPDGLNDAVLLATAPALASTVLALYEEIERLQGPGFIASSSPADPT